MDVTIKGTHVQSWTQTPPTSTLAARREPTTVRASRHCGHMDQIRRSTRAQHPIPSQIQQTGGVLAERCDPRLIPGSELSQGMLIAIRARGSRFPPGNQGSRTLSPPTATHTPQSRNCRIGARGRCSGVACPRRPSSHPLVRGKATTCKLMLRHPLPSRRSVAEFSSERLLAWLQVIGTDTVIVLRTRSSWRTPAAGCSDASSMCRSTEHPSLRQCSAAVATLDGEPLPRQGGSITPPITPSAAATWAARRPPPEWTNG